MTGEVVPFSAPRGAPAPEPRALPACVEAEQQLIGAILLTPDALRTVANIIAPEHFTEDIHRRIWTIACGLVADGKEPSLPLIRSFAGDHALGDGGMTMRGYLARLYAEAPPPSAAKGFAEVVRDLAHRRAIIEAAQAALDEAYDTPVGVAPAPIAERFIETARAVLDADDRSKSGAAADRARIIAEEIHAAQAGQLTFETFSTGYDALNSVMRWRAGDIIVTAGRPGMGKSILATSMGRRIAQSGVGVLEFPLENGADEATARHIAELAYRPRDPIPFSAIMTREVVDEGDRFLVDNAVKRLDSLPLYIDDSERITLARLEARIRQVKAKMKAKGVKLGVVMLDHLDYIQAGDRYAGNRVQEISEIMLGLKALARREGVAINVYSQLSRAVEQRPLKDRRPNLSDLRNSGDIEQVADQVMFLYREQYYLQREADFLAGKAEAVQAEIDSQNKVEIIVAKARRGPTRTAHMFCDPAASLISGRMR
jgi:replicative DNA helicase